MSGQAEHAVDLPYLLDQMLRSVPLPCDLLESLWVSFPVHRPALAANPGVDSELWLRFAGSADREIWEGLARPRAWPFGPDHVEAAVGSRPGPRVAPLADMLTMFEGKLAPATTKRLGRLMSSPTMQLAVAFNAGSLPGLASMLDPASQPRFLWAYLTQAAEATCLEMLASPIPNPPGLRGAAQAHASRGSIWRDSSVQQLIVIRGELVPEALRMCLSGSLPETAAAWDVVLAAAKSPLVRDFEEMFEGLLRREDVRSDLVWRLEENPLLPDGLVGILRERKSPLASRQRVGSYEDASLDQVARWRMALLGQPEAFAPSFLQLRKLVLEWGRAEDDVPLRNAVQSWAGSLLHVFGRREVERLFRKAGSRFDPRLLERRRARHWESHHRFDYWRYDWTPDTNRYDVEPLLDRVFADFTSGSLRSKEERDLCEAIAARLGEDVGVWKVFLRLSVSKALSCRQLISAARKGV